MVVAGACVGVGVAVVAVAVAVAAAAAAAAAVAVAFAVALAVAVDVPAAGVIVVAAAAFSEIFLAPVSMSAVTSRVSLWSVDIHSCFPMLLCMATRSTIGVGLLSTTIAWQSLYSSSIIVDASKPDRKIPKPYTLNPKP